MSKTSWTITAEEDPDTGDVILPLPEDMLKAAGWVEGDTLEWVDNNDGSWSLIKITGDKNDSQGKEN